MYCSACGVAVTQNLTYCNYCGAKLGGAKSEQPEVKPEMLVGAMVMIFVFGLVAITLFMGMLKGVLHLETGQLLAFAVLSFLIMVSLEGVFVRLLFRRKRGTDEAVDAVQLKGQTTSELNAPRVLPEPLSSVTEHTTRAFEPVYNKESKR